MKKNDLWTGTCEGYTYDGLGVVRFGDFVFFVPGLIEGETARLGVTAMKKNYGYARLVELLSASPQRVKPACSICRVCGGCQLMHMSLAEQKRFKRDKVKYLFRQNAHMDLEVPEILEGEKLLHYRNKVQVPVQVQKGKVLMGFYQNHSNRIIPFETCLVQTAESNAIVQTIRHLLEKYRCGAAVRHVLIKHAQHTDQMMVCLIVREYPFPHAQELFGDLLSAFSNIRSLSVLLNRRESNVILDGKEILIHGDPYIEEELMGLRFRISVRSFFQINPYATEILYTKALAAAGLNGQQTVVDLYCGTGTIGLLAAGRAKQVYGIEIVADAVQDARRNAQLNGIRNIEFMNADARDGAGKLLARHVHPDVVIVDPPRKGCSRETLDAIETMAPERFVYVSCDPSTLARDCAYMAQRGWHVSALQPVDMFPNTIHVETVALMSRVRD